MSGLLSVQKPRLQMVVANDRQSIAHALKQCQIKVEVWQSGVPLTDSSRYGADLAEHPRLLEASPQLTPL